MRSVWGTLFIALLILALPVHGQACGVATPGGIMPDTDCDAVPDALDNCQGVANSQQADLDRDGTGDACDSLIEEVTVQPDTHIRQGDFAHITIKVFNNRDGPISDIAITARNQDLKASETQTLARLPAGESASLDFWLQVPACATKGRYTIALTTSFVAPYARERTSEAQQFLIYVDEGDRCGRTQGPLDSTIIGVFGKVDLDRGQDAIIPVTITNKGTGQADYHVSLDDLGAWGSWRVDPVADISVPAGHDATVFLYVQTEPTTQAGTRTVQLTVASDGQKTVVPIDVYVRAPLSQGWALGALVLKGIIVIVIMVLIGLVGMFLASRLQRKPTPKKQAPETKKEAPKRPRKTIAIDTAEKPKRETYY